VSPLTQGLRYRAACDIGNATGSEAYRKLKQIKTRVIGCRQ